MVLAETVVADYFFYPAHLTPSFRSKIHAKMTGFAHQSNLYLSIYLFPSIFGALFLSLSIIDIELFSFAFKYRKNKHNFFSFKLYVMKYLKCLYFKCAEQHIERKQRKRVNEWIVHRTDITGKSVASKFFHQECTKLIHLFRI